MGVQKGVREILAIVGMGLIMFDWYCAVIEYFISFLLFCSLSTLFLPRETNPFTLYTSLFCFEGLVGIGRMGPCTRGNRGILVLASHIFLPAFDQTHREIKLKQAIADFAQFFLESIVQSVGAHFNHRRTVLFVGFCPGGEENIIDDAFASFPSRRLK